MIKYSFVIPTYNNKKLLKNTLEALNYQDGFGKDDYEVIISDDGSTDNTKEYIEGINKNYSLKYVYIERDDDSCRSKTRNMGWQAASGEIIIFIDSDIIVRNDYLKEMERCFSKDKDILVFGTRLMLQEDVSIESISDGSIFNKYYYSLEKEEILEDRHVLLNQFSHNASSHPFSWALIYTCNIAITKDNIEKIGGFDVNFKNWGVEDLEFGYRAFINDIKLVYNYNAEVLHQYHFSQSNSNREGKIKNAKYFYKKHPEALSFFPEEIRIIILIGEESNTGENILLSDKLEVMHQVKGKIEKSGIEIPNAQAERVIIDYKDKKDLDVVKDKILSYENSSGIEVVVNDYVEDGELAIWIQTLGDFRFAIRYYAISRKI